MRFEKTNLATEPSSSRFRFFLWTVMAVLTLLPMTAEAAGGHQSVAPDTPTARGHNKMAADLADFPLNADGTVSVIIQFNQTPKAQHFADMATRGGRLKFSLDRINGAAYRIPVRMLAWLQNHPDVAYVSPDRPNQVASSDDNPGPDDDIPAVTVDIARQQYGIDGTGV